VEFCQTRDIAITAYSPFGSPDRPWAKPEDPKVLEEPKLVDIGKKYGKSPAQVVLRWLVIIIYDINKFLRRNKLIPVVL